MYYLLTFLLTRFYSLFYVSHSTFYRHRDDEFGAGKPSRHIGELHYSQAAKLEHVHCTATGPDVAMETDPHVTCFCEKNEYTHTWDTYPAHLAAVEVGQYGGTVLVSNPGICSIHRHHENCDTLYGDHGLAGYSGPTGTTVRFTKGAGGDIHKKPDEPTFFELDSNIVNDIREGNMPTASSADSGFPTSNTDYGSTCR